MGKKRNSKKRSNSIEQAATCAVQDLTTTKEDLSMQRHDEETALSAIYGNDFSSETGAWNCPLYKIRIRRASEVTDHGGVHVHDANNDDGKKIELTLQIQLNKKYPYSIPMIQLTNVIGCPTAKLSDLINLLQLKAKECADLGCVMGWELGQVVEEYLVDYSLKLERENKQRERDMNGQYKSNDDGIDNLDYCSIGEINGDNNSDHRSNPPSPGRESFDGDVQKEIARQMKALDLAEKMRRHRREVRASLSSTYLPRQSENYEDENDEDFLELSDEYNQLDLEFQPTSSSSAFGRYETDFVELGPLGRGGGGEVVKAINKLDRRVYAIKRIVLESDEFDEEKGSKSKNKWAEVQNQKLRREVTTISRMTHKNIVRYYQAWVESTNIKSESESTKMKEEEDGGNDNNDISSGYSWKSSASSNTSSPYSSSSSDEAIENIIHKTSQQTIEYGRSQSLDNFLEHEIQMKDFPNPFLFHDQDHGEELRYHEPVSSAKLDSDPDKLQRQRKHSIDGSRKILYIQMEYCKTTMRDMIDESKLSIDLVWKFLRQILEALVYIHNEKVIHRDLKPANIFVDTEGEIKLGDFGLATTHKSVIDASEISTPENEAESLHAAINNVSELVGSHSLDRHLSTRSITQGVGTVFYVAPEQLNKSKNGDSSYDSKADIFSLGVLLFEMFNLRPFATYMERADMLNALRGDTRTATERETHKPLFSNDGSVVGDWKSTANSRFSDEFRQSVPDHAQRLILWCLERNPSNRPTAKIILTSGLLPRKVELEQRYLDEVLQTLSDPQSEQSYHSILAKLFERPNPKHVLTTYDTDLTVKTKSSHDIASHMLISSLSAIKGSHWNSHSLNTASSPMSAISTAAAATALRRAKNIPNASGGGKEGEALRGVALQASAIIAMREATSVAVSGSVESTIGSDPYLVDALCSRLSSIFRSHGASCLRPPCLRPLDQNIDLYSVNRPAEVINDLGYVLLMRENLTANFARAVARCGLSANNVKRFDIDTVYQKSDAGGQPKQVLEASFDITSDTFNGRTLMEAEIILVLCRVMSILSPARIVEAPQIVLQSPVWFLRLSHTQLSEAIMDLLTVPRSNVIRQACLNIFTSTTAPNPIELLNERTQRHSGKHKKKFRELKENKLAFATKCLNSLIENDHLPTSAADRFRAFISVGNSLPYPTNAYKAIDTIFNAAKHLYQTDINSGIDAPPRGSKRAFEEIAKSISNIKSLLDTLSSFGISLTAPYNNNAGTKRNSQLSNPAYISLDLGLRHDYAHYHGIIYQAILVQDNFFEDDNSRSHGGSSGKGARIAEGGSYDELVRHFRPPGNLSTPIPLCVGIRFSVGKLLERMYQNAAFHDFTVSSTRYSSHIENIRRSLGYPFNENSSQVQVMITSEHGLDKATLNERAKVASLLWSCGISCDYTAQSGLFMSVLKPLYSDNNDPTTSFEWDVEMICGICAVFKIPFVIIVVPHLLSSRNVVKLRATTLKTTTGEQYNRTTGSDELVNLPSLPSVISERLRSKEDNSLENILPESNSSSDLQLLFQSRQTHNIDVDCTYVMNDQYYDDAHKVKSDNVQWKNIKKVMKTSAQKMTNHLNHLRNPLNSSGHSIPVVATDLPFVVVRDIGSCLMLNGVSSLHSSEIGTKYPQYKKILRTLMYALDNQCQKSKSLSKGSCADVDSSDKLTLSVFLYSIPCDKYDLVTLSM